jgi:hypothetical protein
MAAYSLDLSRDASIALLLVIFVLLGLLLVESDVWRTISLIGVFGALGGLAFALASSRTHTLHLPFQGKGINTGFLGDMFIGFLSGIVGVVLISILFGSSNLTYHKNIKILDTSQIQIECNNIIKVINEEPSQSRTTETHSEASEETNNQQCDKKNLISNILSIIAVSILSGFYGLKLLSGLSEKLFSDLQNKADNIEKKMENVERIIEEADKKEKTLINYTKSTELIGDARRRMDNKEFSLALDLLNSAAEYHPTARLYGLMAYCEAELNRPEDALKSTSAALALGDTPPGIKSVLFWNRACYNSLLNNNIEQIIDDIKSAQKLNFNIKDNAQDPHLSWAQTQPKFVEAFPDWNEWIKPAIDQQA